MKLIDRFGAYFAAKLPSVKKLLTHAGNAIREANAVRKDAELDHLIADELQLQRFIGAQRTNEILMFKRAELACVNPEAVQSISEAGVSSPAEFKERLWELELALEDRGWVREVALSNLEFSRLGVQQLIRITRIYAIKNPLIKRGVEICALYVFGRGVEIRSDDEAANETIQDFLDANQNELGHVGLAEKEKAIQTDGSLYFGLKTDAKGSVTVQMIDALEVMEVITKEDDPSCPMYFFRQWNRTRFDPEKGQIVEPMKCWYPAVECVMDKPKLKPKTIATAEVNWDMPILRVKIGSPASWRWGIPPLYAAIDWSRAYKDFLEDWATVQRALSRFALTVETKGGAGAIAAYNALLNTTFADSSGTQIERNPPPVTGSAHISGPDNKIAAFKSAGAQTSPEQARRMLLMVAAATGMPETFFGDASTGSLATAQSLDRPTELKFTEIQRRYRHTLTTMLRYVLMVSGTTPGGRMREAAKKPNDPVRIIVKFPTVVEHNVKDMIQAIAEVGTLGGRNGIPAGIVDRRTIADLFLAEIGIEDRDELLDEMGYGEDYSPKEDIEDQRTQPAPQEVGPTAPGSPTPASPKPAAKPAKPKESLLRARKELKAAVEAIAKR